MKISDKYIFSNSGDLELLRDVLNNRKLSGTRDAIQNYEKKLSTFFDS